MVWFGKDPFQPPCHGQRHLSLDQVVQSPAFPGMGIYEKYVLLHCFVWECHDLKYFQQTENKWPKIWKKMAHVPLPPQLFLLFTDKIPRAEASPSIPCHPFHPFSTAGATIPGPPLGLISRVSVLGAEPNGGALFWDHHPVVSRFPCLMTVFPCSGGSHLSPCVLSVLLPAWVRLSPGAAAASSGCRLCMAGDWQLMVSLQIAAWKIRGECARGGERRKEGEWMVVLKENWSLINFYSVRFFILNNKALNAEFHSPFIGCQDLAGWQKLWL